MYKIKQDKTPAYMAKVFMKSPALPIYRKSYEQLIDALEEGETVLFSFWFLKHKIHHGAESMAGLQELEAS